MPLSFSPVSLLYILCWRVIVSSGGIVGIKKESSFFSPRRQICPPCSLNVNSGGQLEFLPLFVYFLLTTFLLQSSLKFQNHRSPAPFPALRPPATSMKLNCHLWVKLGEMSFTKTGGSFDLLRTFRTFLSQV